jgi:tetratricopeptide (TPR) repeat protein
MGEVWAGTHRLLGQQVAIKFLTAEGLRERDFVRAFRTEVRAVAALDHPAIVRVHDFGEVSEEAAAATGGQLPAGSPWLAMERVDGGTLAPLVGRLRWPEVRSVVLGLLDALGHAHARAVIHRDLKPGNVLVHPQDDTDTLLVQLTDFGLAQAVDDRGDLDIPFAGGTPAYMAPEQFDSRWRDYGPWSDLYALGTLVWSLVTGSPPFGRSSSDKRQQHLWRSPPPLRPTCDVPPGLEAWLRRLLEKEPSQRYRRAADARYDFTSLGQATVPPRAVPQGPQAEVDTLVIEPGPDVQPLADVPTLDHDHDPTSTVQLPLGPLATDLPPLAPTWNAARGRDDEAPIGLGLFGLRPVPLVDRRTERDALWSALVRVARTGQAHALVLRGAPGVGKTRLARWLAERSHELGAAIPLWARHRAVAGDDQGLPAMLRSFLRCHGMARDAVRARVGLLYERLGVDHRDEWHALTEVLSPATDDDTAEVRFGSLMERYVTMRRLLQRVCTERPVVVCLDDAQFGVDALRFADYLLGYPNRTPLPVLVVATVDDEALSDRLDAATVLEELLARDRCMSLSLGPLPPAHRPALVRGILGLEPTLAERVDAHTRGNPLFAVELVGDWVQEGVLEPSPEGFRARGELALPATVEAMWQRRIDRFDDELTRAESRALELAAVLGVDVRAEEWSGACARAVRADPSDHLVRRMLHLGLAETHLDHHTGWSFTHTSLRQAVLARAERAGRLAGWHALVASLLQDRARALPSWPRGLAERVGMHCLGADEPERALPHLLEGIAERRHVGDYVIAERLLAAYEQALSRAGVPESDPRWGQGWVERYETAHERGQSVDADRWLQVASEESKKHGWHDLHRRTQHFRARLRRLAGDYEGAMTALKHAEQQAAKAGDRQIMARCRQEAGETLLESGDVAGAEHWLRLALAEYRSLGHELGCAATWRRLGDVLKERGAYEEAHELLLQAERQLSSLGHRLGTAEALNSRGDVARAQGDLRTAARLYRRSRGLFKAIGSTLWIFPEYNVAMVHLERGDLARARPIVELSLHRFASAGHQHATAHAHLALAVCAGVRRRFDTWDDHVHEARVLLGRTGYADEDTARLAFRAGQVASDGGHPDRALNAWSLSRSLWRILDRTSELKRVERLLRPQD